MDADAESRRLWQIKDEIWRKLLVRLKELRNSEDARARAVDGLGMEHEQPARPAAGTSEPERLVDEA
jgi:hypothetical protein